MGDSPATSTKIRPLRWRWKLWHLMALVAATAAAMAVDRLSPGTLYAWAILVAFTAPLFLATLDWSRPLNRLLRICRIPRRSLRVLAIKAVILVMFLAAYRLWIALVTPWLKAWSPE